MSFSNGSIPSSSAVVSTGATLQYADSSYVTQSGITFSGSGTLQKTGSGTLTFGGSAAVTWDLQDGALIDVEGGTFEDGNPADEWSGNQADLEINAGAIFNGLGASVVVNALDDGPAGGGTLDTGLSGTGPATITLAAAGGEGRSAGASRTTLRPSLTS